MSEDKIPFTLLNEDYFPTFDDIPQEGRPDLRYHRILSTVDVGIMMTTKTWCLLTEIVDVIPYSRPTFIVKDKAGNRLLVSFYLDNGVEFPKKWYKNAQPGNTMAFMSPCAHFFLDGQVGLRIEQIDESTLVFPCSLQEFFKLEEVVEIEAQNTKKQLDSIDTSSNGLVCSRKPCEKPGKAKCASCKFAPYCGKECQTIDWKQGGHNSVCAAIDTLLTWSVKTWDFQNYVAPEVPAFGK